VIRGRRAAGAIALLIAAAAPLVGPATGWAAGLAVSTGSLGAASVAVPRCTTTALTVLPVLSGSTVSSVSVSGLPASCGGATVRATVDTGTARGSGSSTVPAGGGSLSVSITSGPALVAATAIELVVEGP
jgi:hypothetical protein